MADDAPVESAARAPRRRLSAADAAPYALVALLYLVTSPYHRGLNNPNEMVRVYMTKAWVDTGSFVIDPVIRQWGMVDDKALRDGQLYSSKAPLQSLVGIPAYAVAPTVLDALGAKQDKRTLTWVIRVLGSSVFGIGFAWILIAWCRRRSLELGAARPLGTTLGLGLALGTMLYPYSVTFTGHGIAALTAGGCYLAIVALSRSPEGGRDWILAALGAGFLGGAAPFSEYPSALVAGPVLVAAFAMTSTWARRAQLFGWLALGGALPFGLGLWAHHQLWGHPFRTGYTYLENQSYVEVHGEGFFGVSFPKSEAFVGALVSPGTGLFFFSPLLIAGFVAVAARLVRRRSDAERALRWPLAMAAIIGFAASLYFISSHKGWRGGWTVGPRYIVAVAPMLGLWAVEAVRWPRARPVVAGLAGLSIVTTGFAGALYPHLSDVYTNPLASFLWPSYRAGEMTYGLGHTLGLTGTAANAIHIVPLVAAVAYAVAAATRAQTTRVARAREGITAAAVIGLGIVIIGVIPERDPGAAKRENRRLWGFWEPTGPGEGPKSARRHHRPGRIYRARTRYRRIAIEADTESGSRACGRFKDGFCRYGDQPWQRFGPERLRMAGIDEDVLFLHPIAGRAVRARIPVRRAAKTFVLRYGMADASVNADNPHPIRLTLKQAGEVLSETDVERVAGLKKLELPLTSTAAVTLEITVQQDGARVFGFDVEQYR